MTTFKVLLCTNCTDFDLSRMFSPPRGYLLRVFFQDMSPEAKHQTDLQQGCVQKPLPPSETCGPIQSRRSKGIYGKSEY